MTIREKCREFQKQYENLLANKAPFWFAEFYNQCLTKIEEDKQKREAT